EYDNFVIRRVGDGEDFANCRHPPANQPFEPFLRPLRIELRKILARMIRPRASRGVNGHRVRTFLRSNESIPRQAEPRGPVQGSSMGRSGGSDQFGIWIAVRQ